MQLKKILTPWQAEDDDRGAVLVLFAIMAVVLFGFAAIAVDSAHAFVERRDSQATADVSAIGGAITLINNSGDDTARATELVTETMSIAARNLGAGLDWAGCSDGGKPSQFTISAADVLSGSLSTDCVSWTDDWTEVRVRIPTREVNTFFAGVIGFDTININAFAEVESVVNPVGGVLPLGIPAGDATGVVCLKTGPQPPPGCDENVSGNFDFLDFKIFGNPLIGTTENCNATNVAENIAHGVDHAIGLAPSSPIDHAGILADSNITKEVAECNSRTGSDVQAIKSETGNKAPAIERGFVTGENGYQGRLTLGSSTARRYDFHGYLIDDVGLWEYLSDAGKAACGNPAPASESAIITCIQAHPTTVLFDDSILFSARIAQVPELWQSDWPSGSSEYLSIQNLTFVYIQTLYGGTCNKGNPKICTQEISPGLSGTKRPASDSTKPIALTALAIPPGTLSQNVRDSFGLPVVETYALSR